MPASLRLAVDIGGTFTDLAIANADGTILATAKTLTTPQDPTEAALSGTRQLLADLGRGFADLGLFIHGTTLATNALIERRGARLASITTEGFRDILEIGYERRYNQYAIDLEKPEALVSRAQSFTVPERMSAEGQVLKALDEAALPALLTALDQAEAEAVAICLLHAYANPAHEQRLRDLLAAARPDLAISLSSEVSPEAREYDRLCTTLANSYIQPMMAGYLAQLEEAFVAAGLTCPILMITSAAGMTPLETARRLPIRLVESGPSGGAILAAQVAERAGLEQVLSFDMGGTTAKLCLIDGYEPQRSRAFEVGRAARFIKGSGLPLRIPVVELIEIGAGGGSLAKVDQLGRLSVGPESAGSEPGPAGFGRGGTGATVSDADVALGYIDPERFAEGRLAIDRAAAESALLREVGAPLGLGVSTAAGALSEIVDESMASAGRMHAVESGKDLGARAMIAFGGNGPLHATRVARRAGVKTILVPPNPGVGSAVGFLSAPVSFEVVRSRYSLLQELDLAAINQLLADMQAEAEAVVRLAAGDASMETKRSAFLRYRGQGHEVPVDLPQAALQAADVEALQAAFESAYRALFTRPVPGMVVEILNWSVAVSTPREALPRTAPCQTAQQATVVQRRQIRCDASGALVEAAVYDRAGLSPGDWLQGPALVVEPQTTTLVSQGWRARVAADQTLILEAEEAA
ncbi:MAG: hydantoinase/oxoprolinase family protein [Pseudomonadota bacterium]